MTNTEIAKQIRSMGLSCQYRQGEFRITYVAADSIKLKVLAEDAAYYTTDPGDAFGTAVNMRRWADNHDDRGHWIGPVTNENGWTP